MNQSSAPFNRRDAVRDGVTDWRLGRADFRRLYRGIYVSATRQVDLALRAQAALDFAAPNGFVSHHTAARLWGGVAPRSPFIHVSQPTKNRSIKQGLMVHLAGKSVRTTRFRRLPISTPEQCFLEVAAAGADLVELVVLGDSLVKAKRTTPDALIKASDGSRAYRARAARKAARYVRSEVDSAKESQLRMLLVLAGMPEPQVNFVLRNADGSWKRRFDMYYEEFNLLVEYDGRQHAENTEQWESDIIRREELDRLGKRLITITRNGLYREPLQSLTRVRSALVELGATGLPASFCDDWRPFFGD
jgi:very-short-patch-repair endonuclease